MRKGNFDYVLVSFSLLPIAYNIYRNKVTSPLKTRSEPSKKLTVAI